MARIHRVQRARSLHPQVDGDCAASESPSSTWRRSSAVCPRRPSPGRGPGLRTLHLHTCGDRVAELAASGCAPAWELMHRPRDERGTGKVARHRAFSEAAFYPRRADLLATAWDGAPLPCECCAPTWSCAISSRPDIASSPTRHAPGATWADAGETTTAHLLAALEYVHRTDGCATAASPLFAHGEARRRLRCDATRAELFEYRVRTQILCEPEDDGGRALLEGAVPACIVPTMAARQPTTTTTKALRSGMRSRCNARCV